MLSMVSDLMRSSCPCARMELEMKSVGVRAQLTAIAELRWRMFVNGLRSRRGKMELASRIIVASVFAIGGLGGFGLAIAISWFFVSDGRPEFLAIPLWGVFLFWQFFPVMATAFTNNSDSTELFRFPLPYRTYLLVRLAYGYFGPASTLGSLGLLGVLIGVTVARPSLFPWTLLILLMFALFNLVLMQMIFAWIERWLAQRRTREIFGVVFILSTLIFQPSGPIAARLSKGPHPELRRDLRIAAQVQAILPPGLATDAIAKV